MLALLVGGAVVGSLLYMNVTDKKEKYANPYYPVESGHFEKIGRHREFGFVRGHMPAKLTYKNPLPYRVVNEFNSKLLETRFGYAKKHFDTQGYHNILQDKLLLNEHPRIDIFRQQLSKGRHRRRTYDF